jgi:hypothetical protein
VAGITRTPRRDRRIRIARCGGRQLYSHPTASAGLKEGRRSRQASRSRRAAKARLRAGRRGGRHHAHIQPRLQDSKTSQVHGMLHPCIKTESKAGIPFTPNRSRMVQTGCAVPDNTLTANRSKATRGEARWQAARSRPTAAEEPKQLGWWQASRTHPTAGEGRERRRGGRHRAYIQPRRAGLDRGDGSRRHSRKGMRTGRCWGDVKVQSKSGYSTGRSDTVD